MFNYWNSFMPFFIKIPVHDIPVEVEGHVVAGEWNQYRDIQADRNRRERS